MAAFYVSSHIEKLWNYWHSIVILTGGTTFVHTGSLSLGETTSTIENGGAKIFFYSYLERQKVRN